MPKLTVLIPCKNEQQHIKLCIESVRAIADEILVADSGSTDETLDIVRELGGCRIIQREFVSYADFKNWAIPQATHEWVLIVDADERVTPELAEEIRSILAGDPSADAYEMQRTHFFLGQEIRHCGWNHSYVRRLFRKSVCRYRICRVHEVLEVDTGRTGRLVARLLHFTCMHFDTFVQKQVQYSLFSAEDRYERGSQVGYLKMLVHAPLRFWQLYLLRGGILDGFAGLVICTIMAYYTFLKDAKLWALQLEAKKGRKPELSPNRAEQTQSSGRSAGPKISQARIQRTEKSRKIGYPQAKKVLTSAVPTNSSTAHSEIRGFGERLRLNY